MWLVRARTICLADSTPHCGLVSFSRVARALSFLPILSLAAYALSLPLAPTPTTPRTCRCRPTGTHLPPTTHTRPSTGLLPCPRAPGPDPHVPTHIDRSLAPSRVTTTAPLHAAPPRPFPSPPSCATAPLCAALPPPLPSMRCRCRPTIGSSIALVRIFYHFEIRSGGSYPLIKTYVDAAGVGSSMGITQFMLTSANVSSSSALVCDVLITMFSTHGHLPFSLLLTHRDRSLFLLDPEEDQLHGD